MMLPSIVFYGAQLASMGAKVDGYIGLIFTFFAPIPILFVVVLLAWNAIYLYFSPKTNTKKIRSHSSNGKNQGTSIEISILTSKLFFFHTYIIFYFRLFNKFL